MSTARTGQRRMSLCLSCSVDLPAILKHGLATMACVEMVDPHHCSESEVDTTWEPSRGRNGRRGSTTNVEPMHVTVVADIHTEATRTRHIRG